MVRGAHQWAPLLLNGTLYVLKSAGVFLHRDACFLGTDLPSWVCPQRSRMPARLHGVPTSSPLSWGYVTEGVRLWVQSHHVQGCFTYGGLGERWSGIFRTQSLYQLGGSAFWDEGSIPHVSLKCPVVSLMVRGPQFWIRKLEVTWHQPLLYWMTSNQTFFFVYLWT